MVFVFGIDIPLVELIFVLTLVLALLLALLIYIVINQMKLNKRLKQIFEKENTELRDLKSIEDKEKTEIGLLRRILFGIMPAKGIKLHHKRKLKRSKHVARKIVKGKSKVKKVVYYR